MAFDPARARAGRVLGKRLDELLGRPSGRGMLGDPDMNDVPTAMGQQDEHEEDPSGESWEGEDVHRHHGWSMIREEGAPSL
jgi:hypothetical protein